MKKTITASIALTSLMFIAPHSNADAAHKVTLPTLNKTTLTQMKAGTYKPAGKVKFAMTEKNVLKYAGKPDKQKLLRFGGMPGSGGLATLTYTYKTKSGTFDLELQGHEKAKKQDLKVMQMSARYAKPTVSEATIKKYLGKPSYTSDYDKDIGYNTKDGNNIYFEFKKVKKTVAGKTTSSWNVSRVYIVDFNPRPKWTW